MFKVISETLCVLSVQCTRVLFAMTVNCMQTEEKVEIVMLAMR